MKYKFNNLIEQLEQMKKEHSNFCDKNPEGDCSDCQYCTDNEPYDSSCFVTHIKCIINTSDFRELINKIDKDYSSYCNNQIKGRCKKCKYHDVDSKYMSDCFISYIRSNIKCYLQD